MHRYLFVSLLLLLFLSAAAPALPSAQAPCGQAFGGNPPVPLPGWLQTDVPQAALTTTTSYELLAGQLLRAGIAGGAACPSGGLNMDGSPNGCGLEVARLSVNDWQNRYNAAILAAATAQNLPPKVLKALIAVESQFWPGASWERGEIGLGQMTELGTDAVLTWRPNFYQTYCRKGLGEQTCAKEYQALDPSSQRLLRGLVLQSIDATCPTCAGGVDPARGDAAVSVLAEAVSASCQQTAHVVGLAQGKRSAELLTYEDFWRLTLADYHVGAGCIYQALRGTGNLGSWSAIAAHLPNGCRSGAEYIRRIEEQLIP